MRRREVFGLAAAVGLFAIGSARAATEVPFTQAAFDAAQAAGKPILVAVHAVWCPICAKQKPILAQLAADPAFADLVMFRVDFDSQKDIVRDFGVQMQSTLIAFHGKDERARSVGDTRADSIRALVAKSEA